MTIVHQQRQKHKIEKSNGQGPKLLIHNPKATWERVSRDKRCPVCKQDHWCMVSSDGTWAKCMRNSDGAYRTGRDRTGKEYHLHSLRADDDDQRPPVPPAPDVPLAGTKTLHDV